MLAAEKAQPRELVFPIVRLQPRYGIALHGPEIDKNTHIGEDILSISRMPFWPMGTYRCLKHVLWIR